MPGLFIGILLLSAAVADIIHYASPRPAATIKVQDARRFPAKAGDTLISVYNAYGGIYPGLADMAHKIFSPKTYPCNLCYQAFGNFGMKPGWKSFLDSLPFTITALHKEQFKKQYQPADLPLPAILLSNEDGTRILVSAAELNQPNSLEALISLVKTKLQP